MKNLSVHCGMYLSKFAFLLEQNVSVLRENIPYSNGRSKWALSELQVVSKAVKEDPAHQIHNVDDIQTHSSTQMPFSSQWRKVSVVILMLSVNS